MEKRELSVVEIEKRVKDAKVELGLATCRRMPGAPVTSDNCPAVLVVEGVDDVVKTSNRGNSIYPARRQVEIILEIISKLDYDVRKLYRDVRSKVVMNPAVADGCFIQEHRTEGPNGYDLPDIQGMRLVLLLFYDDDGK